MSMMSHRDYARMVAVSLDKLARDCVFEAFHGHGPGGQGVNTADSAVRTTHVPTGIVVVSRESRSQYRNRQLCLQKIRDELSRRSVPPSVRHATKPTKGSVARRLKAKRARSQTKSLRRRVTGDE
jgi:protein subunit release factor A